MAKGRKTGRSDLDLEEKAVLALEEARKLPPGPGRSEAMKKAGALRAAADQRGMVFAKRGRPSKDQGL
jgi:hypothetical protein